MKHKTDRLCYRCQDWGLFVRDATGTWRCQNGHEALPIVAQHLEAPAAPREQARKARATRPRLHFSSDTRGDSV